ncbi:MAG: nucleotidyltransferase family protein [Oscillospiraceae bacterium]|nr:nucleotidyltransferase family protein [Oscillospiraceae bacterium]
MNVVGIICEYNPFHNGHARQIRLIRERYGENCAVVCLMSGNFVQRGAPAVYPKLCRAEAAITCGADLVLELPTTYALRSAEGFASGGVEILGKFCGELCFGAEDGDPEKLMTLARGLLSEEYRASLREQLDLGLSFPAARQRALEAMGLEHALVRTPNNILAVEYCKAILASGTAMKPMPIVRGGDYHTTVPEQENPSATALRGLIGKQEAIDPYVPEEAAGILSRGAVHTLLAGERFLLSRLRTMTDEEFEALPFGSEGLWRKLMHESRRQADLESIAQSVKSKRYTRTRIDRMLLCAGLGITETMLEAPVPYVRVLGFNDRGRQVLRTAREKLTLVNIGQRMEHPYQALEERWGALYGLFAQDGPEPPDQEERLRIIYRS